MIVGPPLDLQRRLRQRRQYAQQRGADMQKNILGCDIDKASQSSTNSWCLSSTEVPSAPWLACRTAKPVLALNTPLPSEYDA